MTTMTGETDLVHRPWKPAEIARLCFVRWAVAHGRLGDATTVAHPPVGRAERWAEAPRDWDARMVRTFEDSGDDLRLRGYEYW